jgi:hypothetical protein
MSLYQPNDVYSHNVLILVASYLDELLVVHTLFKELRRLSVASYL